MVGSLLFQRGLRSIALYTTRRAINATAAQLPYGASIGGWRPVVDSLGLGGRWYVATFGGVSDDRACEAIVRAQVARVTAQMIVLLHANSDNAFGADSRTNCLVAGIDVPVIRRRVSALGDGASALAAEGVTVMDSSFRVVYGFRGTGDGLRLEKVMALFDLGRTESATLSASDRTRH